MSTDPDPIKVREENEMQLIDYWEAAGRLSYSDARRGHADRGSKWHKKEKGPEKKQKHSRKTTN